MKDPKDIQAAFDGLFDSFSEQEQLEAEARLLANVFLGQVEDIMTDRQQKGWKTALAKRMSVSPSFVSQLFNGDAPLSDFHKAQIQRYLDIRFEIRAVDTMTATTPLLLPDDRSAEQWWNVWVKPPKYGNSPLPVTVPEYDEACNA